MDDPPPGYFVNLAPVSRSCWSFTRPFIIARPRYRGRCHVLTIGPRGIFAAIYENKNMERIIYKRAQKVYPLRHDYNELDHISSAGLNINKYSSEQRTDGPGSWKYVSPCCQNRPFCKINSLTRAIKWFTVTIIMRKLPVDHEKCKAWIMTGLANNIQYCEYQFKDHYEY